MKQLVLAEKPAMGADIAKALGVRGDRQQGLIEGDEIVITWCIGHLAELAEPHEYRPEWKSWSARTLPILPEEFKLRPRKGSGDQWKVVERQLKRRDIGEVINACDAGREGELIFRMVYDLAGCQKPVRRLWISSLTTDAIRDGFRRLRPGSEMDPLASAAHCRNQADWLVGINATRATTVLGRKSGPDSPLFSVGRVQTPTLAMLAERDFAIERFVPEDYFELWADFDRGDLRYRGRWRGPDNETRFSEIEAARAVESAVAGQPGVVESLEQKTVEEKPPLLFDLTSLQRTANGKYGLSAAKTLAAAQSLYEKHKLITYPRTDSRFLTPDLMPTMRGRVEAVDTGPYAQWAQPLLRRPELPSISRLVQPSKVKDHHAILPTSKTPNLEALSHDERNVYDLIVRRFLGVFYPSARFMDVVAITRVGDHRFRSHGRTLLEAGWRAVAGFDDEKAKPKKAKKKDDDAPEEPEPDAGAELLGRLREGDRVQTVETGIDEKQTKAPPRYTDASLLASMEGAGKLIEDEAVREAMKDQGLGTPATRAAIIETLLDRGYVERDGKAFRVTLAGRALLGTLGVEELKSPEMTGRWEARLSRMARGEESPDRFMHDIRRFVGDATNRILAGKAPEPIRNEIGTCPRCGAQVVSSPRFYECRQAAQGICRVRVAKQIAGKTLTEAQVKPLFAKGRTAVIKGFISKSGKKFQAALVLNEDGGVEFSFDAPPAETKERKPRTRARSDEEGSAPKASRASRSTEEGSTPKAPRASRSRARKDEDGEASVKAPRARKPRASKTSTAPKAGRSAEREPISASRASTQSTQRETATTRASSRSRSTEPAWAQPSQPATGRASARSTEEPAWAQSSRPEEPPPHRDEDAGWPQRRAPSQETAWAQPSRRQERSEPAWSSPQSADLAPSRRAETAISTRTEEAPSREELGVTCPSCHQGRLITGRKGWGCSRWKEGCGFVLWFEISGKSLTAAQARELVENGSTRVLTGFQNARGDSFQGRIQLRPEGNKLVPIVHPEP